MVWPACRNSARAVTSFRPNDSAVIVTSMSPAIRGRRKLVDASTVVEFTNQTIEDLQEVIDNLAEKHANIALLDAELEKASGYTQKYRAFHRLLEAVMAHYISGEYESSGFETWAAFHTRVSECFQAIRSRTGRGRSVAVFTSGGPIGVMMQLVLSAPQKVALDLHWRIFNCSVTKFTFNTERISLDSFNATDHLPPELLTYR